MDIFLKKHLYDHPCPYPICLPTDKYTRQEKVRGIQNVCFMQKCKLKDVYQPMLARLKEKYHTKKRCFILGNGPSINDTDLSKLQDEITFGVNSIFLKFSEIEFRPTFYVVEDHLVAEDRAQEINDLRGVIKFFPVYLAYCLNESPDTIFINHRPRKSYPHGFDFSTNAADITYTGGTVTFTCLQLAYYLGFKEIYLVGVDHSYTVPESTEKKKEYNIDILDMMDDDPNHFSPDYFGKGYRWHDPHPEVMEEAYREALQITSANGVTIYNATQGGCLEVFPRIEYESLFQNRNTEGIILPSDRIVNVSVCPSSGNQENNRRTSGQLQKKVRSSLFNRSPLCAPRVLVVSSTIMNRYSATGSLVKNLFTGWPKASIAQLYTAPGIPDLEVCDKYFRLPRHKFITEKFIQKIKAFKPELIYFRPTDFPSVLIDFVYEYLKKENIGLVTHMMDDWPERARINNPELFLHVTPILCALFRYANFNLSICDRMTDAFQQRYGVPFKSVSNFVNPEDWHSCGNKKNMLTEIFTIRYSGSLAPDMQLESVKDVARAVSLLQGDFPVKLEIYVHRRFRKNARKLRHFKGTEIHDFVTPDRYPKLLQSANLLLLAANFDFKSLSYIRYSMANKLPEYMASGTPMLSYGPAESATIDYARQGGWAKTVTKRDVGAIISAIKELHGDDELCVHLGQAAISHVYKNHRADRIRSDFHQMLVNGKSRDVSMDCESKPNDNRTLIGEYDRTDQIRINETDLVGQIIGADRNGGVMVNVGTHIGSDLPSFLAKGWKIFAFEPDKKNRKILDERYGNQPNVIIDNRAVSDKSESNVPFYSSLESSGISSLTTFHKTHLKAGNVSVTTLGKFCEEQNIDCIDFLLIDAEGHDLFVLKGLDWGKIKPEIIVCEFEDRKTKSLGYGFHDMAMFLKERGYEVLVSEWHPIVRYGIDHDWRRLARYPCEIANPEAWGNLIAFRETPDWQKLLSIAARQAIPKGKNSNILFKLKKAVWERASRRLLKIYW